MQTHHPISSSPPVGERSDSVQPRDMGEEPLHFIWRTAMVVLRLWRLAPVEVNLVLLQQWKHNGSIGWTTALQKHWKVQHRKRQDNRCTQDEALSSTMMFAVPPPSPLQGHSNAATEFCSWLLPGNHHFSSWSTYRTHCRLASLCSCCNNARRAFLSNRRSMPFWKAIKLSLNLSFLHGFHFSTTLQLCWPASIPE